ncbi:restriction endonuclease subunit S [Leuconostoc citreum]|uniref:restriction endonuclease subunit S n=1 Tax=Leuconostoc citreum TaxID=33964 RepID=UPI0015F76C62|nr:restriction endonuclease subunit S [Leuconostoc citreum]MBA5938985.1 restriction endonuclease subunit S [Leuconostoc citreum]
MKFKLSEISKISNGKKAVFYDDGTVPVYGANGPIGTTQNSKYNVGDIVIGRVGANAGAVHRPISNFWASDNTMVVTPGERVRSEYLTWLLQKTNFNQMTSGSAQPLLNQDILNSIDFEIPGLSEQDYVISVIEPFENQMGVLTSINDNLTELITVMFNQSKDAWPTAALGSLLHPESKSIKKKEQKKARFLNTGDVTNGVFENVDLSDTDSMPGQAKKLINRDDILYSEIRPVNRHFGLVRLDKPEEYVVSTKLMVLRRNEDVQLPVEYLYFLLTSAAMIREMQFEAESRSGTFPQITFDVIKGYQVPVPPTNHPILGLIKTAINNKIDNDTESALLAETRDTLLNELLH